MLPSWIAGVLVTVSMPALALQLLCIISCVSNPANKQHKPPYLHSHVCECFSSAHLSSEGHHETHSGVEVSTRCPTKSKDCKHLKAAGEEAVAAAVLVSCTVVCICGKAALERCLGTHSIDSIIRCCTISLPLYTDVLSVVAANKQSKNTNAGQYHTGTVQY